MPAIRATASASPLGTVPSRSAATHSALSSTRPAAVAERAVTALSETSTMRASPAALRCGKRPSLTATPQSAWRLVEQPYVNLLTGGNELGVFRQDHQPVRSGKIAEQMGTVSTGKLHLPVSQASGPDDAPGQLQTTRNGLHVMGRCAFHHRPHVRASTDQLANDRAYEGLERHEGTHRVAGKHDHRNSIMADQSEALRLAWLHGDLCKVAGTHLWHHRLHDVEVALTDSACCQDQVRAQQLISDQPFEFIAIVTYLSDSEHLSIRRLGGSCQQVRVRVVDLLLAAELNPWIHQLRSSGDHHHSRTRPDLYLLQTDACQHPNIAWTQMITLAEQPGA